ncbi:hypothetical protein CJ030_MR0G007887 [Morella rubra]|uniref:PGG domain-containing protein n=1 Tax=Morella rubra TaxID=262757 RepID=A0A6A1UIZ8_9ROSI|nr:hypothetical protein CJ030_MR0G007887 [Morella rubra]
MEEGAINMPHKRRQKAEIEIFPQALRHPQQVSSAQENDHQASSPNGSLIATEYSPSLDQLRATFYHGQVDVGARDGSLQALWQLLFKVNLLLPLRSLLRWNFSDREAARLLQGPSFVTPQETSLDAGSSQQEFIQITIEEPRPHEYRALCAPLLQAALRGNWRAAKAFLKQHPRCVRVAITKEQGTALHYAAAAKRTRFVEELVKLMTPLDLELKTTEGWTALCFAAQSGKVRIAEEMVKRNNKLPCIRTNQGTTPLQIAASVGRKNMVFYLLSATRLEQLSMGERVELFLATISTNMYDISLEILSKDPKLATSEAGYGWKALEELAKKPDAIGSKSSNGLWNKALMKTLAHQLVEALWKEFEKFSDDQSSSSNVVHNPMALLVEAIKVGNIEFVVILLRSNPDLMWQLDKKRGSLFHIAVAHRQESVFTLIHELGTLKDSIASYSLENNNNMLHLAGQLAPSDRLNLISGPALQMQRELLWFKEIKKMVPPSHVNEKNSEGETPRDILMRTHKELQKNAERWIKDKASSCMIVATLIATVVFTAIFTVPGGYNQNTGIPILLNESAFSVFSASSVIAFMSSSSSILMFLSMLTSRYTEEDLRKWLPAGLVFGLILLFISIVGLVVAFVATGSLVYWVNQKIDSTGKYYIGESVVYDANLIPLFACVPISLFVLSHYGLWLDIIRSAYFSRFLFWKRKRRIF